MEIEKKRKKSQCSKPKSNMHRYDPLETACDSLRGVIAFLNGVDLEESLFSFGVLVAKMVGVICACGSSLAVGPEGPMIHIGATIGLPRNAEIVPNCSKL
jgi:hypothetical protein